MLSLYPAYFIKEDCGYSVIFPDLNFLATSGSTFEEAMAMAIDCLAGHLYVCKELGEDIPKASALSELNPASILRELYEEDTPECTIHMITVDVAAYAKTHFEKAVKKTLTIPAWMNERALSMGINFSQLLQEALLTKMKE